METKLTGSKRSDRRIPKDRRKRAAASCDHCKVKRNKCERPDYDETGTGPCRACEESGIQCQYTIPRKRRVSSDVPGKRKYEYVDATFYRVSDLESLSDSPPRASTSQRLRTPNDDHLPPLLEYPEHLSQSSFHRYLQPASSTHYGGLGTNDHPNHHYQGQQHSTAIPHTALPNIGSSTGSFANLLASSNIDSMHHTFRAPGNISGDHLDGSAAATATGAAEQQQQLRPPTPPLSHIQDMAKMNGSNEDLRLQFQRQHVSAVASGSNQGGQHPDLAKFGYKHPHKLEDNHSNVNDQGVQLLPDLPTSSTNGRHLHDSVVLKDDDSSNVRPPASARFGAERDIILFANKLKYIGQHGSYSFLLQVRNLFAEDVGHQVMARDNQAQAAIGDIPILPEDRQFADGLVDHFFNTIHRDFPIFHRDSFLNTYKQAWNPNAPSVGASCMLCIYIVFVLSIENYEIADDMKRSFQDKYVKLVRQIQNTVLDGSSLADVQALMIYVFYLYMNGQQDLSWNLLGAAVRIAVGINLHRGDSAFKIDTVDRDLRRRVWWTMYMFERLQCASLGRASCIDDFDCTETPRDGFLDHAEYLPNGLIQAQISLTTILGTICKRFYLLDALSSDNLRMASDFYERLRVWRDQLPYPLRHGSGLSDTHCRQMYLLHGLFHYTVCFLMRPFLSFMAIDGWNNGLNQSDEQHVRHFSTLCASSALECKQYMHRLHEMGQFNQHTWLDIYFVYYSSSMLSTQALVLAKQTKNTEFVAIKEHVLSNDILLNTYQEKSREMERFARMALEISRVLREVVNKRLVENEPIDDSELGILAPETNLWFEV